MVRVTLTSCLLGAFVLSGSGCMTCCPPAPCPWDNPFYGCVETGPLGGMRPSHAERREMRRALRNSFSGEACPTCQGGYDMGYDGGYDTSMEMMPRGYGMTGGGHCPTCQQNMPMNMPMEMPANNYPMMPSSPGMEVQPHEMMVPNPTPMSPSPMAPGGTPMPGAAPGPMATPNSTSQFYPTGASPLFTGSTAAMPMQGQNYGASYGQMTQRPPQILPFSASPRGQSASIAPVAPQMVMQAGATMPATSVPPQGAVTSAEMVYIPSQQPYYVPAQPAARASVPQVLYAP